MVNEPPSPVQPDPPASVQLPVMLFPCSVPVRVSVLPEGDPDSTTKEMPPVTVPAVSVVNVDVPLSVCPDTKQVPVVRKLNCETFNDPSPLTVKFVMKLSTEPSPLPPASTACHKPLDVAAVLVVLLPPQPPSANSHANKASTANFFMRRP